MPNTSDWELSADLKVNRSIISLSPINNAHTQSISNVVKYLGIGGNTNSPSKLLAALGFTNDIEGALWDTSHGNYGSGYHAVKITKQGNSYSFYYDSTLFASTNSQGMSSYTPLYLYARCDGGTFYCKNLKLKPL